MVRGAAATEDVAFGNAWDASRRWRCVGIELLEYGAFRADTGDVTIKKSPVLTRFVPLSAVLIIILAVVGIVGRVDRSVAFPADSYWETGINQATLPPIWERVEQLAASHTHATTHNDLPDEDRAALLIEGELEAWCLQVVVPSVMVLRSEGYLVRHVRVIGLGEFDASGKIPSHHVIEVWDEPAGEWRIADIDRGQRLEQTATSLTNFSWGDVTPLEDNAEPIGDPASYPLFMEAVGFVVPSYGYVYDPDRYSTEQIDVLDDYGWIGLANFDEFFYSS